MGESIAEGTIVRWIKKVGDSVDRDEPLFEISTDKVDAEIPSPVAGVLLEITAREGETVPVNTPVATIGAPGSQPVTATAAPSTIPSTPAASGAPAATAPVVEAEVTGGVEATAVSGRARQRSSPLVRRIAREHQIDVARVPGTGANSRVTKKDILAFIARGGMGAVATAPAVASPALAAAPIVHLAGDRVEPMSVMRRKIAEHMVFSKHTSAHVYSVFEINYSRVDHIRRTKKDEYERAGLKLTYTTFIAKALVDCLRRHPMLNASIDGANVVYRGSVNLGIAVALEHGLIVPVIKGAEQLSLMGLARAIQDVADRARAKKLNPEEVQGGTFTLTNPGNYGAQFGLPVINQPQVGILGVGTIEKRPVVIDDAIGIRLMGYLAMGFDHRLVDGAVADQFLADLKKTIEHFDPNQA
jgi:2-oxoglutarate dehydrogenase E2 component (dihydrolipoamide succinyltransferase)